MKVKLIDVAREAGVSEATASLVLNRRPGVNANTRDRVFEAAKRLGYTPNSIARNLATQRSRTIGLVVTDINNPFFGALTQYVDRFVKKRGYSLILSLSDDDIKKEESIIDDFVGKMVEGLVIVPTLLRPRSDFSIFERLKALSIPFVFISSYYPNYEADYIMANLTEGSYELTRHLIDRGARDIRFLGVRDSHVVPVAARLAGVTRALEEAGRTWDESILVGGADATYESGYRATLELLKRERPDALMGMNDIMALGATRAIAELGLSIPEDIVVAGYDDVVFAQISGVPLTTVRQNIEGFCERGVERLFERIDGEEEVDTIHEFIPTELVVRDSTVGAH